MARTKTPPARLSIDRRSRPVWMAEAQAHGVKAVQFEMGPRDEGWRVGLHAPRNAWVTRDLSDDWQVWYRLCSQDGAIVVGEVRVYPRETRKGGRSYGGLTIGGTVKNDGEWSAEFLGSAAPVPPGGLTGAVLKQVRIGADVASGIEAVMAEKRSASSVGRWLERMMARTGFKSAKRQTTQGKGGGRPGRPARFYADAARAYVDAAGRGERGLNQAVAARLKISITQARDAVLRARRLGFLTAAAGQGVPSTAPRLTPEGEAALRSRPK